MLSYESFCRFIRKEKEKEKDLIEGEIGVVNKRNI